MYARKCNGRLPYHHGWLREERCFNQQWRLEIRPIEIYTSQWQIYEVCRTRKIARRNKMSQSRKKLLIVDNTGKNKILLGELFSPDYEMIEVNDNVKAIEVLRNNGCELAAVFLSIVMPVIESLDFLEYLNKEKMVDKIPVFLIFEDTTTDVMSKGFHLGAADIIEQSVSPVIIKRRVESVIELFQHRNHLDTLVEQQTNASQELLHTKNSVIETLSTVIEFRSEESNRHVKQIQQMTKMLLMEIVKQNPQYQLSLEDISIMSQAAAMHDLGKICIPDTILNKPCKLTPEEFQVMQTHTIRGCDILNHVVIAGEQQLIQYSYEICRYHHERWDGQGYPDGLREDEIPISAQVVSIVDVYDALVSKRVYKEAFSHEKALQIIEKERGRAFNPMLVACFMQIAQQIRAEVYASKEGTSVVQSQAFGTSDCAFVSDSIETKERNIHLLNLENERFHILSKLSNEIIFEYDRRNNSIEFSKNFQDVFGESYQISDALKFWKMTQMIDKDDKKWINLALRKVTAEAPTHRLEAKLKDASGNEMWFEIYINTLWEKSDAKSWNRCIGKITDIHELKSESIYWQRCAMHDALTGLYNKEAIKIKICQWIDESDTEELALLFIDIDNYKMINDTYGHDIGDLVLENFAVALKRQFQANTSIGRIGGDEFLIAIKGKENIEHLTEKLHRVYDVFKEITIPRLNKSISASIGISLYPKDGEDYATLFKKADQALYHSKKNGKNQFQFFS